MSSSPTSMPAEPPPGPDQRHPKWRKLLGYRLIRVALLVLLAPAFPWLVLQTSPARARVRAVAASELARRLPGAHLGGDLHFDGFFRVVVGPIEVRSRTAGVPLLLTVRKVTVRPRLSALLALRLEAASISLEGVTVGARRHGEGLEELAKLITPTTATGEARTASNEHPVHLTFDDLSLVFGPRSFGPLAGDLDLLRAGEVTTVESAVRLPGGGRGSLRLRLAPRERTLEVRIGRLAPGTLLAASLTHLPFQIEGGRLDVSVSLPHLGRLTSGEVHFEASLTDLVLRGARLAPEPVGPIALRAEGTLRWDVASRTVALEDTRIDLGTGGDAGVVLGLEVVGRPDPRLRLEVRATDLDWDEALAALPEALTAPPDAPPLRGALSGWLQVSGPLHEWDRWRLEGALDPPQLAAAPHRLHTVDLSHSFTFQARRPDGSTQAVLVGPENPMFVPLSALPPLVVRAVLASEDAGFYGHHGFDFGEMQEALSSAGARGRLRGASTISQQVAKNVFLSPERTLGRKMREALTTVSLEVALGKRRLLEVYLNLVEWGPGVYGIGAAAHHWFGKDVRDLDPKEAAFLASIIPNPIRYEMYRRRGGLTEAWESRVRGLLLKLRAADAISDDDLHRVWDERLAFARGT
jgi:penicillin-binding protein 1A